MLVLKVGWGWWVGVLVGLMDMFVVWELRNLRLLLLKDVFFVGWIIFVVKLVVRVVVVVVVVGEGK